MAYSVAIHKDVREALLRQAELEQAFLEMDSDVAQVKQKLESDVDTVVTRSLTGVLATIIAGLTTEEVRGWPSIAVGLGIGAYLVIQASLVLPAAGRGVNARLDAFSELIRSRGMGLSDQLLKQLNGWRVATANRILALRRGLYGLGVAIGIGSLVMTAVIDPLN